MRMARDRKRALRRGEDGERLFQSDVIMEEDGAVQRLYRDDSDDAQV